MLWFLQSFFGRLYGAPVDIPQSLILIPKKTGKVVSDGFKKLVLTTYPDALFDLKVHQVDVSVYLPSEKKAFNIIPFPGHEEIRENCFLKYANQSLRGTLELIVPFWQRA